MATLIHGFRLKYISAVVQKNVIPLNEEMTFFLREPSLGQRALGGMVFWAPRSPSPAPLVGMAQLMPMTEDGMLATNGVGHRKLARSGEAFMDLIIEYCRR